MAKKLAHAFDNEILESSSKKQVGCIGGIFQLFDCQQLLGGKQLTEQDNRRDPSAHAPESPRISLSCNLEKNQGRRCQDNTRYSMESSRTSFSSTFTSFSSLDHKSPQEEPIYTQHSFFSGRSPKTRCADINLCGGTMKEDDSKRNKAMKSIHSPRPMELSKFNDLDEPLRKELKLKRSSERFSEGPSPRFSYDGAEISHAFDRTKNGKHGGHSRLSLDSKEGLLKCNLTPKINTAMKEFDTNVNTRVSATLNQGQDQLSNDKNSSIVAKLMGLEPLNSATQNGIKCYDHFNKQTQNVAHERKQEKTLQSLRNIAKSPRRNNQYLDSPTKFSIEEAPQRVQEYVEENINQKIESVLIKAEKRLQKLPFYYSSKQLRNLKCVISETKNDSNRTLSTVSSLSTQLAPPNYRPNEVRIRASKYPFGIIEPARKLNVSFSKVIKFEGHPGLEKIRTSDSRSNRKFDFWNTQTNADKNFTEKKANCRGSHPLSKEQSERAVNNAVSPRLQQMKPDLKMKASATIPSSDSIKSPRQPVNSQLLDSDSPRGKLRKKLDKVPEIKLQNSGEQINVDAIKVNSSIERKSLLLQQNNQSKSVKVNTGVALMSEAKQPVILKEPSAKEINLVFPRRSCPNSVPNALLNKFDLLHSPASVSEVFKEYQNLPSDRIFTMECPPLTIPSVVSSRTASKISERKNTTIQGSRDVGTTINEAHATNATMFTLENQDQDSTIEAEIFLVCGFLQKESNLISILEQITSDKPSEFFQKKNRQKLHQKLIFDFVNEILAQKMDVSSSCGLFDHMLYSRSFSIRHLYKKLCSEIKYLGCCKENNVDKNSRTHKDVLWHSQAWGSIESEIPVLVLEIERLIFKDLINEVVMM